MNRRKYLINSSLDTSYTKNGLRLWVDSLLNNKENKLIDQTNNYQSTLLDGKFQILNNTIYLNNTRFAFPCGADIQGNYTITVVYKRYTSGIGAIYSFADPVNYLTGRYIAGHNPTNSNYWFASELNDSRFTANDTKPHSVTIVINKFDGTCQSYHDGTIQSNWSSLMVPRTSDPNLKLIIGGYMNSDKKMEFGSLYGLRLYNRALTPQEIAKDYEIDKVRFLL